MTKGNFHSVLRHLHFARHWLERAEGEFSRAETDQAELTLSLAEAEVREAWEESRRARAARLNLLSETVQDWKRRASAVPVRVRGLWAGACGAVVVGGLLALSAYPASAPLAPAGSAQVVRRAVAPALSVASQPVSSDKPSGRVAGPSETPQAVSPGNRDGAETKVQETGNNTIAAERQLLVAAVDQVADITGRGRLAGVLTQAPPEAERNLEAPAVTGVPIGDEATRAPGTPKAPETPKASESANVVAAQKDAIEPKATVVPKALATPKAVEVAKVAEAPKAAVMTIGSQPPKPSEADAPAKPTVSLDLMELLQAAQQSLYNK